MPSPRLGRLPLVSLLLVLASAAAAPAQPKGPQPWWPTQPRPRPFLHPLFSSDAVLQRDAAVPVWGWSAPGDRVTVSVDGKPAGAAAVADGRGRWEAKIGPFPAGGPHGVTVAGTARKEVLANVLFGDVWLCAGQSNMNWPVRLAADGEAEARKADDPEIRSFTVGFYPSLVPLDLPPPAKWEVGTPENVRNFTAVGYFFARHLREKHRVPIGLVHASAGATAAEAWTSADALRRRMPYDFPDRLAELERAAAAGGPDFDYFRALGAWAAAVDPVGAARKYTSDPDLDAADWLDVAVPKDWKQAGLKGHDGLVWFRRTVEVPAAWAGRDLSLILSVVHDADVVWFNGTLVGAKQIAGAHRTYEIDAALVKPGKNLLVAAVVNGAGPGGFCSAATNVLLRPAKEPGTQKVGLAGTWKAKAGPTAAALAAAPMPEPRVGHYKTICSLYNGMIAPLVPFALKGALWYQGEANGPFWLQYRRLLPTLIADWRGRFGAGDFPFLIVSLAAYNARQTKPVEPGWAEIRESQWRTARRVPNAGLASTIDIGDGGNIHPANKQEAGRRLALVARHLAYGERGLVHSGPAFSEMMVELPKGDRIRLTFDHVGGGLTAKPPGAKLTGFAVAGEDKKFVWADAAIEGDTVVVSSPEVTYPKYVRYGWAWNPIVNLYNEDGLPAVTFRTDE